MTGGAGFIGSHIVDLLVDRGDMVRVLDNFTSGKMSNIVQVADKIEIINGDIRDVALCRQAVSGVDVIFHQAALTSGPESVADPSEYNEVNVTGTLNMLLASRDYDVRSFVYASSAAVYGNDDRLPKKENQECDPTSPYGLSKWAGERWCQLFSPLYGLPTIVLRYFNVFGPRQNGQSQYATVIPNFITTMLRSEAPVIYGDGEQSRDFIYVKDVVRANVMVAEAVDFSGGALNIGTGWGTTINELASMIGSEINARIMPSHIPAVKGDIRHSYADISAAKERIGFESESSLEDGLQQTIDWYKIQ